MLLKATETDRAGILEYCMAEPNLNLFIIGDIENFGFESEFQDVWVQTREEKTTGILLRYHDNFILYSKDLDMDVIEVAGMLETQSVKIISGKSDVIDRVFPYLKGAFEKREMYFCELRNPDRLQGVNAEIKIAKAEDAGKIAAVYGRIAEFAGLYSADKENLKRQIENRIQSKEGVHLFMEQEGAIICHGNTTAETSVSGMIGGILTVPEARNKGLASQMVSALCRSLFERGKSACLFYDNPEAGNIYHRLGFEIIGKWAIAGRIEK